VRGGSRADTPRGPISFDDHGNAVIDIYVRRVEKQGDKMVFSRDFPPMKPRPRPRVSSQAV
jgi:hypothetical protein